MYPCPLCNTKRSSLYFSDAACTYYRCSECELIFLDSRHHLTPTAEKAHYDTHNNDPGDARYRDFLRRLFDPMSQRVSLPARGMDFGCGPGPALALMFAEAGYEMTTYDKYFACDSNALENKYDFITCTEVVEHLAQPGEVLGALLEQILSRGWLGVMTRFITPETDFASWYYRRDPTHIAFYSHTSLRWLAGRHQCDIEFAGDDIALLRKIS